jgi:hypothetical protein
MSALNSSETDTLRRVISAIEILADPDPKRATPDQRKKIAKLAKDNLQTIISMKGYYPK